MASHLRRKLYHRSQLNPAKFTIGVVAVCALLTSCGGLVAGSSAGVGAQVPAITGGTSASSSGTAAGSQQGSSISVSPTKGPAATSHGQTGHAAKPSTRPSKPASGPSQGPPPSAAAPAPPQGTGSGCTAAHNTPGGPDPFGSCWPGPGNTGVPAGTQLSSYRGSCTIRSSHVVISAKAINCAITILASDATIKDSQIEGTVHTDGAGSVLIEHTTINGGSDHSESVGGANLTVLYDNIYGDQHEVHCYSNCTVEDSWLHDNYNGASLGWHENGFFNDGGSNFTVVHNSVYCVGGCTADITFIPDGNVSYATVSKNLLVATRYAGYCLYPSSDPQYKPGIMTHIVVTDNVFQRGSNGKCATYGPVYGWDRPNNNPGTDGYGNVWSGNMWDNGSPLRM
jgi:hypothetical protein